MLRASRFLLEPQIGRSLCLSPVGLSVDLSPPSECPTCRAASGHTANFVVDTAREMHRRPRLQKNRPAPRGPECPHSACSRHGVRKLGPIEPFVLPDTNDSNGSNFRLWAGGRRRSVALACYSSTCSEMAKASSTSIPTYCTVLSSFWWPSRSWTARRLPVFL